MKRCASHSSPRIRQDRLPTLEELGWLQSDEGDATCAAMAAGKPADSPAAIARWRQRLPAEYVAAAWTQVTLRAAARPKFSRADEMLFDRVGLEQATDEVVAAHKARRFAGMGRVADLCCGIGGDSLALAGRAEVIAVDWSPVRVAMAEHNAAVYGHRIATTADDVTFVRPDADAAHVDPDRRPAGPRRHQPEASSPDLEVLEQIVRHYEHVAIKLSPGADFDALPFDAEIELISHKGECKQAVIWTGRLEQTHRRATALPSGESVSAAANDDAMIWPPPRLPAADCLLFEPDPAVIRAHLVGPLARRHGLSPIDEQVAYLVGDRPISTALLTPFRVIDVASFSIKRLRPWLAKHDVGRIDIKTRGFAARPDDILRRLHLTGRRHAVLFLTRIKRHPLAILAEPVPRSHRASPTAEPMVQ